MARLQRLDIVLACSGAGNNLANTSLPNVQAFILADTIIVDRYTEKKTLVGLFGNWRSASFPFQTMPFVMFVQLHGVLGPIDLLVKVVSLKDQSVILEAPAIKAESKDKNAPMDFMLHFQGVKFEQAGFYTFEIYVGENELLKDFRVEVKEIQKAVDHENDS